MHQTAPFYATKNIRNSKIGKLPMWQFRDLLTDEMMYLELLEYYFINYLNKVYIKNLRTSKSSLCFSNIMNLKPLSLFNKKLNSFCRWLLILHTSPPDCICSLHFLHIQIMDSNQSLNCILSKLIEKNKNVK